MHMDITCTSEQEMKVCAREFIGAQFPHAQHATVCGLSGELGAGKTTFAKHAAEALGVEEMVTSPTFVILKAYRLPERQQFDHLVHIDAYRLGSGQELTDLGWENLIATPENLILIEWPERVRDIMPQWAETLLFEPIDEHTRRITTISHD